MEPIRNARHSGAGILLTEARSEGLEYCRSIGHLYRGDSRPIKGHVHRLHGEASETVPSSAPGLDPEAGHLRSFEKTCLPQERIPVESSGVIVDEVEDRLSAGANLDRLFERSHPDLNYADGGPSAEWPWESHPGLSQNRARPSPATGLVRRSRPAAVRHNRSASPAAG